MLYLTNISVNCVEIVFYVQLALSVVDIVEYIVDSSVFCGPQIHSRYCPKTVVVVSKTPLQ